MTKRGELPERRTYLRLYLTEIRAQLIQDQGPLEKDLTAARRILIDRVLSKLCILRVTEEELKEHGIFVKGGEGGLRPVLDVYRSFTNSLRLDLVALGIDKRASDTIMDPFALMRAVDAEVAEADSTKKEEIARPSASQGEIPVGKDDDDGEDVHGLA